MAIEDDQKFAVIGGKAFLLDNPSAPRTSWLASPPLLPGNMEAEERNSRTYDQGSDSAFHDRLF